MTNKKKFQVINNENYNVKKIKNILLFDDGICFNQILISKNGLEKGCYDLIVLEHYFLKYVICKLVPEIALGELINAKHSYLSKEVFYKLCNTLIKTHTLKKCSLPPGYYGFRRIQMCDSSDMSKTYTLSTNNKNKSNTTEENIRLIKEKENEIKFKIKLETLFREKLKNHFSM